MEYDQLFKRREFEILKHKKHYLIWKTILYGFVVLILFWGLLKLFNLHIIILDRPVFRLYFPLGGSVIVGYLTIYYVRVVRSKKMNNNAEAALAFSFLMVIILSISFIVFIGNSGYNKVVDRESKLPTKYLYDIELASYEVDSVNYIIFYEKMLPFIYKKIGPYEVRSIEQIREDLSSHSIVIDYQGKSIIFTNGETFELK